MSVKESLIELPAQYSSAVFGQLDEYAKKIEKTLKVTIIARDSDVKVIGAEGAVKKAAGVLNNLIELARRGNQITEQNVDYALSLAFEEKEDAILEIDTDIICPGRLQVSRLSRKPSDKRHMLMKSVIK